MPLKLVPQRKGKSFNFSIRGTYLGVAVDKSSGPPKREVAECIRRRLEAAIERGEYPPRKIVIALVLDWAEIDMSHGPVPQRRLQLQAEKARPLRTGSLRVQDPQLKSKLARAKLAH